MPTYEYECETCGIHFEKLQRISDEPLHECPECQGPVRRVLHPVGIVFKGSGWYCTDHRSSSATSSGSAKDSGNGSTGKTEKKEEAKSEKKEAAKAAE